MTEGPLAAYRRMRGVGTLREDPDQELAAEKLQSLYHALRGYNPTRGQDTWKVRFGLARAPEPPQGLYIYGGVGRGKSMLMDLFYGCAPVERKRRVHFHRFMMEAHEFLHSWRQAHAGPIGKTRGAEEALPELARQIATNAWLLCFDEFHVTDIADAMILGRLFARLFELGVVVVATSNWAPDDLYKGGLQRDRFVPFIHLLKERLDVLGLEDGIDYRRHRLRQIPLYHTPLNDETARQMNSTFAHLTAGSRPGPAVLRVHGRAVEIPFAARGVSWFHFHDLCEKPLGAADYLAIATHYHTVLLDRVPLLRPEQRNEAKRLMTLIDALYEHRVNVVIAAEGPAHLLYPKGTHAFEFERTVSRLAEMQSQDYIARPHLT